MLTSISELAYAKINLTLDITGKRDDGYHTIDSIMQTVTLTDTVTLTFDSEGNGISLSCNIPELSGDNNLCCKAANAFMKTIGVTGSIHIELSKHIPVAAGLGGGSADAAAVLRMLHRLFPREMTKETLLILASRLGADVPFCMIGGSMRARGIGEELEALPSFPKYPIVIARRGEGISAAEAYRLYDACPSSEFYTDVAVNALERGDTDRILPYLSNAFEHVIFPVRPEAMHICDQLRSLGARTAHMSGSGSAVFGIFDCGDQAQYAADFLRKCDTFAAVCYPCDIKISE